MQTEAIAEIQVVCFESKIFWNIQDLLLYRVLRTI